MEELKSLAIELNPVHLQALEEQANWDLTVDPASLDSYIKQTRSSLAESGHAEQYEAKLIRKGPMHYVLLLNPYNVLKRLREQKDDTGEKLVSDEQYAALVERVNDIGSRSELGE